MNKAIISHSTTLDVPFFDVDFMQIVWHGHYVKYLEIARCALLDELQYSYMAMKEHGYVWPVVKMDFKYIKSAHFAQQLTINVHLVEYETCLRCRYDIMDANSNTKLTKANTTQVAVNIETGEMQFQTPDSWQQAVKQYISRNK